MLKLALHGPRYSGKSYLARALEAQGFQYLNYTDLIKEMLCEALAAIGIHLTVEQIHADKEFYRNLIIEFATVAGFDDGFGVERMLSEIRPDATGVVFDNVRFLPQWAKLEAEGFTLVRLVTQDQHRAARAMAVGVTAERMLAAGIEEQTEQALPPQPGEILLHQNGPIERVLDHLTAQVVARALTPAPMPAAEVKLLSAPATKKAK